jgi:DNA-binding NarL/FixJ family response regulator
MPVTVAIVEDDSRIQKSLRLMLTTDPGVLCVGAFGTAASAIASIPPLNPDVVFMDVHLPDHSGIEVVRFLAATPRPPQIVMLTSYDDSEAIFNSLSAGASGYLLKPIRTSELLAAVRDVHSGGAPMTGAIARKVVQAFARPVVQPATATEDLSPREQEILALLSEGFLYKEIADRLNVAYATVRTHIERIYQKLHVRSRAQAVASLKRTVSQ